MSSRIGDCPIGFEDGHIVAYRANSASLQLEYQFWNEAHGLFIFEEFVALHDNGALKVTVGAVLTTKSSELLNETIRRQYDRAPAEIPWNHYQFLALDDKPLLEVIAESCAFHRIEP